MRRVFFFRSTLAQPQAVSFWALILAANAGATFFYFVSLKSFYPDMSAQLAHAAGSPVLASTQTL